MGHEISVRSISRRRTSACGSEVWIPRTVTRRRELARFAVDPDHRGGEAVYWEHPHPEALYQFRVKDFGPLTVAMDSHGRHLFEEVKAEARRRLPDIYARLGIQGEPPE